MSVRKYMVDRWLTIQSASFYSTNIQNLEDTANYQTFKLLCYSFFNNFL